MFRTALSYIIEAIFAFVVSFITVVCVLVAAAIHWGLI